jgi:hypothetical protein
LPPWVKEHYASHPAQLTANLAALSIILRLWATAGELILALISLTLDLPGAMGDAEAVGRVPMHTTLPPPPQLQESSAR